MPDTTTDPFPRWLQLLVQALIAYSIVTVALETVPDLAEYRSFFRASEIIVVVIFTVEYAARWLLAGNRLTYPLHPFAIIDLLVILPFYLQFGIDLRALRALRLLRIFRILKLARYSQALQTLGEAVKRSAPELGVFAFMVAVVVLLSAMALYYVEHDAQPEVYSSIPASLWWAIVTLTTVGYGDVYPVTLLGRFVAALIMLTGIGLIAVPTGILSSTMTDLLGERREQKQKHSS